ncbi:TlpA family protein disulfide reductase [Pedobacter gandavensis]|uniref:Redoxin domain-containing protein n=1 Tax=Pedobacter gandavensis TaxID=2679963 RepID=A0ABR6EQ75_9SPHI|nr:TlpA disulfide reductase family protein [Pedobacter gandavensis]MBB2147392.1 redoxin domain-containing protein [Pedobacter gandavensis]
MRKLLVFLLLCSCYLVEANAGPGKATVNCTVYGNTQSGLYLYQLKDGEAQSLGFQRPDANGNCKFVVTLKEGAYFFKKAGGKGNTFNHVIYLKAGEEKKVAFQIGSVSLDYDSCIIEKPNTETQYLKDYLLAFNKYNKTVSNKQAQSYAEYKLFQQFAAAFLQKHKTSNVYFNQWLKDKIGTDLQYLMAANYFNFGTRLNTSYDSAARVQEFYEPLRDKKIVNNPALLQSENGMQMLSYVFAFWKFNRVKNGKELNPFYFAENTPMISNLQVKVAYLANRMKNITKYEDFVNNVQPYKALFVSAEMKAAYDKRYEDLYLFAKGSPGYNFELKDVNDKTHKLSDFKGKVVIIDLWAMWCAPCLKEKPIMGKIEQGYHDRNDIVFIGVSVDGINRSDLWKGFVKRNGWTNLELISDATSSIHQYYKVSGIPRFLVFDRNGNIVTVDAPMPSNPEFKKLIDRTLATAN